MQVCAFGLYGLSSQLTDEAWHSLSNKRYWTNLNPATTCLLVSWRYPFETGLSYQWSEVCNDSNTRQQESSRQWSIRQQIHQSTLMRFDAFLCMVGWSQPQKRSTAFTVMDLIRCIPCTRPAKIPTLKHARSLPRLHPPALFPVKLPASFLKDFLTSWSMHAPVSREWKIYRGTSFIIGPSLPLQHWAADKLPIMLEAVPFIEAPWID